LIDNNRAIATNLLHGKNIQQFYFHFSVPSRNQVQEDRTAQLVANGELPLKE